MSTLKSRKLVHSWSLAVTQRATPSLEGKQGKPPSSAPRVLQICANVKAVPRR